jgi:Fe-S-cluster containining protein
MSEYQVQEFACAMCGNCCRGEGYVRVTPQDVDAMAALLGLSVDAFRTQYTREPEIAEHAAVGDLWLTDKPGPEMECVFLKGNRCRVHEAKPVQCIGFPLKWRTPDVMDYCLGMQR